MKDLQVALAVVLCVAPLQARPGPDLVDAFETLSRARAHAEKGRWFWACEAWLDVLKREEGRSVPAEAAQARLRECLLMAEARRKDASLPRGERFYFDTLRRYVLLDHGALWTRWRALEKEARYAEEVRWFLWGPSAHLFEAAWGDARATRAADAFAEGWTRLEAGAWLPAAQRLRACLALRGDHFLARRWLADCESRMRDLGIAVAPSAPSMRGSPSEKLAEGRAAFRRGRWSDALAWFRSVPAQARRDVDRPGAEVVPDVGAQARRAAKRLDWMFE